MTDDYTQRVEVGPAFRQWWLDNGRPTSWPEIGTIRFALEAWTVDAPEDWQDVVRTTLSLYPDQYRVLLFRYPADFGLELVEVAARIYHHDITRACQQLIREYEQQEAS